MTHRMVAIALSACMFLSAACGKAPDVALRERAEAWQSLLTDIYNKRVDQAAAVTKLSEFVEPSAARDQRAQEYYTQWQLAIQNTKSFSCSVADVSIDQDARHGTVRYSLVTQWQDGNTVTQSQSTKWILADGAWYRIIEQATISR